MQLVFTVQEFRLLIDVLLESEHDAVTCGQQNCPASPLIQKALAHDLCLGIDELENLEEILKGYAAKLAHEVAECRTESTAELTKKQQLLEHLIDRVTEACAMA